MANTSTMLVPLEGLIVRDPVSKDILSSTGEIKPLIGPEGRYWRRRIKDGSVKIVSPISKSRTKFKRGGE